MRHFDLAVLGAGPRLKAAIQAAKLGKSVCLIEKQRVVGAAINTGTILKSLRGDPPTPASSASVNRDPFRAPPTRPQRTRRFDHLTARCA